MNRICCFVVGGLCMALVGSSASRLQAAEKPDEAAQAFITRYEAEIKPLEITLNLAWWKANTSGKDEDFAAKVEAQNKYDAALANRQRFAELKKVKEAKPSDPVLARQIDVLYRIYLEKQVEPELLNRITSK